MWSFFILETCEFGVILPNFMCRVLDAQIIDANIEKDTKLKALRGDHLQESDKYTSYSLKQRESII